MANPDHVAVLKQGKDAIERWHKEGGHGNGLDLSGMTFTDVDLQGCQFTGANFAGAKFDNTDLTSTHFHDCVLTGAHFDSAWASAVSPPTFSGGNLDHVSFCDVRIPGVSFSDVEGRNITIQMSLMARAQIRVCAFHSLSIERTNLSGATLENVRILAGSFRQIDFSRAIFAKVVLDRVRMISVEFFEATIQANEWSEVSGLQAVSSLHTTQLERDPRYVEDSPLEIFERWCDWERLRRFGRMPLFGLSYSVLVLIPTYIYLLAWYNQQVDRLSAVQGPAGEWVGAHLHKLPMPSLSLLLLCSTILLATGSTIYTLACPTRIAEFSKDVWCDQLKRPLLHYWPYTWKYRWLRVACGVCYIVGGLGALWVLLSKVYKAGQFIIENSTI